MNEWLPWQVQQKFNIKCLTEVGVFLEYWLALMLTTIPERAGNLDFSLKFVQIRKAPAAVELQVFSLENVVSYEHLIPDSAASCRTEDGRNERWMVNNHMDLASLNIVHNK